MFRYESEYIQDHLDEYQRLMAEIGGQFKRLPKDQFREWFLYYHHRERYAEWALRKALDDLEPNREGLQPFVPVGFGG